MIGDRVGVQIQTQDRMELAKRKKGFTFINIVHTPDIRGHNYEKFKHKTQRD